MKLNLLYMFKDHHIYSTCVKINKTKSRRQIIIEDFNTILIDSMISRNFCFKFIQFRNQFHSINIDLI